MTEKVWNVAAYCRLSRDDGDKAESNSIGSQRDIIREFLRDRTDMVIVKEYVDDGYSGVNFDRPGFKQMMEDIRQKKINCIVCKDLSRFARNYIDSGRYLEKIWFNGNRTDKETGQKKEYCKKQFEKYICKDFSRFH